MKKKLDRIIEESIRLELNVANLYKLFSEIFSQDYDFWNKLYLEEENHALLIEAAKVLIASCEEFPVEILDPSLSSLIEANSKVVSLLKECRSKPPLRKDAFMIAIDLEESAGEIHFQTAMAKPPTSSNLRTYQELNKNDKDHAKRIREYMDSKVTQEQVQ